MREKLGDGWKIERVPKDMGGATALLVTKLKSSPVRDVSMSITAYHGTQHNAENRKQAKTFAARYPELRFHFTEHYSELSDSLKARPDSAYMEGCVDERGEIWIRLDMVAPERLEAVCLHELIGHLGLENLLGEKFHPFIDEFYRQHKNDALADTIRQRYGIDDAHGDINAKRLLAREMLANIAETPGAKPTFWQKVLDTIRELLRAIGFELKWNQRDLDRLFAKDEAFLRNSTLNEIKANLAVANSETVSFSVSQQEESLAQMERDDQMQALRKAMDSGELPAHTFEELVNTILNFQTKSEFIKKFKAERRKQIYANQDMRIKMKTLDSDKLNAVFEHLSTIFKQYAPHYTYNRRRQINVARAMHLIGESTVNAVMHNRVDADGNYGNAGTGQVASARKRETDVNGGKRTLTEENGR